MKFYVGFSTAIKSNPVSYIIRKIEGADFSHCYLKFYVEEYDVWLVYHASHLMIHFLSEERFLEKSKVIEEYELDLPEEVVRNLIKNAFSKAGVPYAWRQIFGMMGVRLLYRWFKWKIKNPLGDGRKAQICSELLYYDLKDNIDFADFEPEWHGPNELKRYIEEFTKKED